MIPFTIFLLIAILALTFIPMFLKMRRKARAERSGNLMVGTVRSVEQTGTYLNKQPVLHVRLDAQSADGTHIQTTVKQVFSLIDPPRAGQQLAVVVDPLKPEEAFVATDQALQRNDPIAQSVRTMAAVPPEMQGGKPCVGDIVDITPLPNGNSSCQVEVVRIDRQPDTVFSNQMLDQGEFGYAVGDRVYLLTDAAMPPRSGYILSLSFSQGQRIEKTGNRLDAIVLAEDLQFAGAKASARVESAEELPLPPGYREQGVSKWVLSVSVTPENGGRSYQASARLACSTPEKAARISLVGGNLPIRYDPNDPQTLMIDTIAMGWGDPKLAQQKIATIRAHAADMAQHATGSLSRTAR